MRIRTAGVVAVLGLALAASGCGDSGSDDKRPVASAFPAAGRSAAGHPIALGRRARLG